MALENTDLFLIQDKDTKANYQVSYETLTDDLVIDLNLADLGQWVRSNDGYLTPKTSGDIVQIDGGPGGIPTMVWGDKSSTGSGGELTYDTANSLWTFNAVKDEADGAGDNRVQLHADGEIAANLATLAASVSSNWNADGAAAIKVTNYGEETFGVLTSGDVEIRKSLTVGNTGVSGAKIHGTIIVDGDDLTDDGEDIYAYRVVRDDGIRSWLDFAGNASFEGNVTAAGFTGPVTGDITGNITGNINGNVNGDVTGNLTGDVTGDVTGNLTGDVTGNVNGNVTGDVTGDLTGNADTATKLKTARTIALSGDVSGSADFDGSSNITISSTVADDSHNHIISNVDGLQAALDSKLGTGDKAADSDKLDGLNSTQFLRSDTADTASGDITFTGGAGAVTIATGCDIRFAAESGWTGDAVKLQHHDNYLYMQAGSNGIIFRDSGGTNNLIINPSGNLQPNTNNAYDLGTVSNLFRRVYSYNYALESLPALP